MFKKNIKIYSTVSAVLFLEVIIFCLVTQVGFDALISDLPIICAILFLPIIIAFIFNLIPLNPEKENIIKALKIILNTCAVIYYLYWQYTFFAIIMFAILVNHDAKYNYIN